MGLWRLYECLAEAPLNLSTSPMFKVGDGTRGQGAVGESSETSCPLLGKGRGLFWAAQWVDHQRPVWKSRLRFVDRRDGPWGQALIWALVISSAGHG